MLERVWRKGNPHTLLVGNANWYNHYEEEYGESFKKLIIKPLYYSTVPLLVLGIYPEETIIEKDTCTPPFIAGLFTIARTWKKPRCPSADEWIRKLWYIYTMEYYSAIKKNAFETVLMRWVNFESIIQSKVSQKEKQILYINTYLWNLEK